ENNPDVYIEPSLTELVEKTEDKGRRGRSARDLGNMVPSFRQKRREQGPVSRFIQALKHAFKELF
ncbi:MAG: hypothetical protein Q7I97_01710, partial [Thermovirgaceae bacterium]|nr:hypothetical protein [Thermovirgaceae bacterium]